MSRQFLCLFLLSVIASSCTTKQIGLPAPVDHQQALCLLFYQQMDEAIFAHNAEDTSEHRVAGFPFLRSNRFLASFANESLSESAYAQWLEKLRRLDEEARMLEFANLPTDARTRITTRLPAGNSLRQHLKVCGQSLNKTITTTGAATKTKLENAVAVPDNYLTWQRVVGFYPLARWFAKNSIDDLHRELNRPFQLAMDQILTTGKRVRYQPAQPAKLNQQQIGDMLSASYRNPLRIPLLKAEQLARLFRHYAPVWEIDTRNNNDAFGALTFADPATPSIDTGRPTVYVNTSHTRFRGENLLQLIYQIWFPAREKTGWFDPYGGKLDSVIWRVTLNSQGSPVAYDSIHACGCYYLLFPGKGYAASPNEEGGEPVLAPKPIGIDPFRQRLTIRLASRTHYLQHVSAQPNSDQAKNYRLTQYDQLRSLPTAEGKRKNPFGPDGIIDSSTRTERFFLWPFGVASPGAMRQWGSHAIAFVGRRHFDDADLLEKLLVPLKKR
ncbi:hypothetical protein [Methylomarinum vadi]|uniref:hypothetical protein n=1 Tax=Methylomarinum vadi TaxID=438855 RepID=UPI0004DF272C|nr:hypothetical protein [Methylomarinum vadi]